MFHINKRLCALGLLIALSCCFVLSYQARATYIPFTPPWSDDPALEPPEGAGGEVDEDGTIQEPDTGELTQTESSPELVKSEQAGTIVIGPDDPNRQGDSEKWLEGIVGRALDYMFLIGVIIAPLVILIGAFMFFTAAGDPTRAQNAKKVVIWAAIGLAILLFAKAIVGIIEYLLK